MSDGVAIVGMACRFAGSADVDAFWRNVLSCERFFDDPPEADASRWRDPDASLFERVPTLRAGYLGDLWYIDRSSHPARRDVRGIDPAQLLAVDLAARALQDAGSADRAPCRERASVYVGHSPGLNAGNVGWMQLGLGLDQTIDLVRQCLPQATPQALASLRQALRAALPEFDLRTAASLLPDALTARIATRLDFHGAHHTLDAGASSALLALRAGCDDLLAGRADMALAGAVQGAISPQSLMPYARLGLLSRQPAPLPFGQDAAGTLFGEGGALFVLKRVEEAMDEGDRIYAVLRGFGVACEGRGFTLRGGPDEKSHLRALERAYAAAGSRPDAGFIEAHGCGIPAWDRAEFRALDSLFGPSKGGWPEVALGALKGQFGHTGVAAGAAGVVKAALGLHHQILPPSPDNGDPPVSLRMAESTFYIATEARPWVHHSLRPRRAGVSTIGFNGLHAHVVLEEAVPSLG
ncbi:MAG: polyketide synthase [Kiritimatiellia bacterium]|jgi:acyl transferase domain-containing protein